MFNLFGLNTPGPRTYKHFNDFNRNIKITYNPTFRIIQPRSQRLDFIPTPIKDTGSIVPFGENKTDTIEFLKLLKYMIPYPSAPVQPPQPRNLGGLGGPMGPMSPGIMGTKYGNIIVSGPMDLSSYTVQPTGLANGVLGIIEKK